MKTATLPILVILFAVLVSACDKKACKRYCNCENLNFSIEFYDDYLDGEYDEELSPDDPDCYDACLEAMDEASPGCRMSFRSAARCLDKTGCDEDKCEDQLDNADIDCYLDI